MQHDTQPCNEACSPSRTGLLMFLGPMILAPEANQGPLMGLFITGPAGVLIGAIAGLVYGLVKSRRAEC